MLCECSLNETADVFVLLSWNLNKFCLKVAHLILYLLQVLFHSFALAFIAAVNLTGDYLRITIHNHALDSYCFGKIQSCYQSIVLHFIISRREIKSNYAFNLIPFWTMEYYPSST